jgi:Zn-dependent peptidase ImmA (M78 family)
MMPRSSLLRVAKLAAQVLDDSGAHERVEQGYTRVDPIAIAEQAGVAVMARPLDKLLGAFLREDEPGIILNTRRPAGMFHMTCAHELGHFYLGHLTTADEHLDYRSDAAPFEQEADQFAYALMGPAWLITQVLNVQGWGRRAVQDPDTLYQLSLRLGLSYTATVWSLVRTRFLNANLAKTLAALPPAELKRRMVPDGTVLKEHQDVWRLRPADRACVLEPRATDTVVMDLPSHAAAGYLWSLQEAADHGYALEPVTIDGSKESLKAEDVVVGSASTLQYQLKLESGSEVEGTSAPVMLAFREFQPWNASIDDTADSFSLRTKVEMTPSGLSEGTKARVVADLIAT